MEKVYFSEEQRFSNIWFWVFLVIVSTTFLVPTIVPLYSQLVLDTPYGEDPKPLESLLIISGILLVVYTVAIILFRIIKLEVIVRQGGVFYRYPPFVIKERYFLKSEIERFEIRKYKPVREYSGWGISQSWAKSGKAFTVKGNIGLQLYLKDGKGVLFGTQRPDALKKAMNKLRDSSYT